MNEQIDMSEQTEQAPDERLQHLRMLEALLFAAVEPLDEASLSGRLPDGVDLPPLIEELKADYEKRGVNLIKVGGKWALRTAPDLAFLLQKEVQQVRRLSRAATETLAIIAYHQPVTRADIEEIRSVGLSKGTLDLLMEVGWIRIKGRRRTPGRPVTYGTSDEFLNHFGLEDIGDLPGLEELRATGLLDSAPSLDLRPQAEKDKDETGAENGENNDPEGDVSDLLPPPEEEELAAEQE